MKKWILTAGLVLLTACSGRNDALREQAGQQDARIQALEQKLAAAEQGLRAELDKRAAQTEKNAQHSVDQLQLAVQRTTAELEKTDNQLDRKLVALERRLALAQTPASPSATAATPASNPEPVPAVKIPAVSFYSTPDPAAADFVIPPDGPNPDFFPIRVTRVAGNRVVTGKIQTSRLVDTGKIVKDDFGDASPEMKREEITADEYGYQVSCAIENLTRTPKQISISAGAGTTALVVPAAETLTNVVVNAAMGAGLSIEAGGYVRTYPVTY